MYLKDYKKFLYPILFLFFFISWMCLAADINKIISQEVKGSRIIGISLTPLPHSTAVQLTINTSKGQKNIILSRKNAEAALFALKSPGISGTQNAMIANRMIENHLVVSSALTTQTVSPPKKTNAAATVTASITSANQQASK